MGLLETLQQKNDIYQGSEALWSRSNLTCIRYVDSVRRSMFNSSQSQRVVLNKPQSPMTFTNWENTYGDLGTYNIRAERPLEVVRKIRKFNRLETENQPYLLFVWDVDKQQYDVLERKEVENLQEKYGFQYDNSRIDSLEVGDVISPKELLISPTCYDKFGNYGYGRNVATMFTISLHTYEDEFMATEQLCEDMVSTEVDVVKIPVNENDIFLNLMGDDQHYKSFPDIGEAIINKRICAKRTISRARLLYDMKASSLRRINDGDKEFFLNGVVSDIDVYCNRPREELIRTQFNSQLLDYLEMIDQYHRDTIAYIDSLMAQGAKLSSEIMRIYRMFSELLDPKTYRIKRDNKSAFDYMYVEFTVKREQGLYRGQKIAGRMGNKGVIGTRMKDYETFYLDDGTRIDLIVDALGVPNRLNTFQLFEQEITFRAKRVLQKIRETDDIKEKEWYLFTFIKIFSPSEGQQLEDHYKRTCKTKKQKQEYFKITEDNYIAIHVPPFWTDTPLYDAIIKCDETFPFIKPHKVYYYDEIAGEMMETILPQVCGYTYVEKLKQTSKKGFSVRGTGSIGKKGLPEKSDEAKKFRTANSTNPVNIGVQEKLSKLCSVPPEVAMKEMYIHRTSPVARKEFATAELTTPGGVRNFELTDKMTNRDVDIFYVKLLSMGFKLEFEEDRLDMSDTPGVKYHLYHGKHYLETTENMKRIVARDIAKEIMEEKTGVGPIFVGNTEDYDEFREELADKLASTGEFLYYMHG